jgi:hypothetical protein
MMEQVCLSAAASMCRAETPFSGPIVFIDQYDNDQYDCAHACPVARVKVERITALKIAVEKIVVAMSRSETVCRTTEAGMVREGRRGRKNSQG